MLWSRLVEKADILKDAAVVSSAPAEPVLGIAWNRPGQMPRHTLNFVEGDAYLRSDATKTSCVVRADDVEAVAREARERDGNAICIADEGQFESFFSTCAALLDEEQELASALLRLNKMVLENRGMQALVDAVSELFEAPVSVIDNAFNVICYSRAHEIEDMTLRDELVNGRLDNRITSRFRHRAPIDPGSRSMRPLRLDFDFAEKPVNNYLTVIYEKNDPIGSFSVFPQDRQLSAAQEDFLVDVAGVLSMEMQKSSFYALNKSNMFMHLLSVIVGTDSPEELDDARERLRMFGYALERNVQVVLVDTAGTNYRGFELRILANQLQRVMPNSIYAIRESSILFLSSSPERDPLGYEELAAIEKTVGATGALVGVSDSSAELSRAGRQLEQARRAIETGRRLYPTWKVHTFEHLHLFDLVREMSAEHDMGLYMYAPLVALHERDRETGSSLVETLFTYLVKRSDPEAACAKLHIHRNTLRYRLKQIRELMGRDIDRGPEVAQIFLTFTILRCQGRLEDWIAEDWAGDKPPLPGEL